MYTYKCVCVYCFSFSNAKNFVSHVIIMHNFFYEIARLIDIYYIFDILQKKTWDFFYSLFNKVFWNNIFMTFES